MKFNINLFIEEAIKVHKENYLYDKTQEITKKSDKVKIFCKKCLQWFEQDYNHHIKRHQGCPFCNKNERKTTEEFMKDSVNIFGNIYDYNKTKYVNCSTKVCLICHRKDKYGNEHGEFWVIPNTHLSKRTGCPKCAGKIKLTKEQFIKRVREIHGNKYDYSKVEYINNHTKVCIICPEHGEFWQLPSHHLKGSGCPKCANNLRKSTEEFIEESNIVNNFKFIYDKTIYVNNITKVCIICPEHGEFWQLPSHHLNGCGCPKCNQSRLEKEVMQSLEDNNINYEYQKRFNWLGRQSLDFYLPDYNIAIECQGIQHFEPIDFAGKGDEWAKTLLLENQERDKRKFDLCNENNIILYYINYNENITLKIKTILKEII